MMFLRRAEERRHDQSREQEAWLTFFSNGHAGPFVDGFGSLKILDEGRLPPGGGITRRPHCDAEIVTFVRTGTLAWRDSMENSGLVQAGEFRRMTTGRGSRYRETNASRTDWTHVFQIWLDGAQTDREPSHEQKRFSTAERRGRLCVVCSPDGRKESLLIHQDALMYSALLDPGQHVVHELLPGRRAWLHLVQGEATLGGDLVLTTGDGAGIWAERAASLTAQEETEILLIDLREPLPGATSEVLS